MPLPSREVEITYGSLVMGGSSSAYYIDAPIRFSTNPNKAYVEANIIVVGTGESNFNTRCEALETAFRTPRQDLDVKFGAAFHETYSAADYSGMNASPTCDKIGDINTDTGRSRKYRISVAVDLPADLYVDNIGTSTENRRNATINLYTTDAGRRRLAITGTYTASALDARGARAQYNANITTYLGDLVTAFGGTWETAAAPLDPQVATDDMDSVCNFSVVLEEVIFNQSAASIDDLTLRRPKFTISRIVDTSGDSIIYGQAKAERLQRIVIDFTTAVNKSVTQDLVSVWTGTIKPYMTTLAQRTADSPNGFIESEMPTFDYVENRISARITYVSRPGGTLLFARVTTDEASNTGYQLIPVVSKERLKKHRFTGPATMTRTVTIQVQESGFPFDPSVVGPGGLFDGGNALNVGGDDAVVVVNQMVLGGANLATAGMVPEPFKSPDGGDLTRLFLGIVHSTTPKRIGPQNGVGLDITERMIVARYEYYVDAGESLFQADPVILDN